MTTLHRAFEFVLAGSLAGGFLCGCVHTQEPADSSAGTTPLNATSLNLLDVPSVSGTITSYSTSDGPITVAPAKPVSNGVKGAAGQTGHR